MRKAKALCEMKVLNFPITFEEMLRDLMPNVDKKDERLKRFRRFLAATMPRAGLTEDQLLMKAGERIGELKAKEGGFDKFEHGVIKSEFLKWWRLELAHTRSISGSKPKTKRECEQKSVDTRK